MGFGTRWGGRQVVGWFGSGVASADTTGKSHPPVVETRSLEVTLWPVRLCGVAGVGRSFVAQPKGVSRFYRARPQPGFMRVGGDV